MLFGCPSSPCFARSFPPSGSLGKIKKFESTSIVCLRRHFPRYRRFFRAFLSQEKKRKRGKQECGLSIKRLFEKNAGMLFGCPSSPCFARSFPPRGSHEVADNFCRRKFCEQNFMQARGRLDVRQEGRHTKKKKDLFSRQKPTASPKGKPRTRVEYKAFQEKESSPG